MQLTVQDQIRKLIECFIDHPEALRIETKEHPGVVYLTMQPHADDFSKMTGKQGAHFNAIKTVLAALGKSEGTQYVLRRYLEPEPARRREQMPKTIAPNYFVEPARDMLMQLLTAIALEDWQLQVRKTPNTKPTLYTFTILTRSREDYETLIVPASADQPMTLIGALGTLFRAYANRDGVKFNIEAYFVA